jgi:hypothetical protein
MDRTKKVNSQATTGKTFWDILYNLIQKLPSKFISIFIIVLTVIILGLTIFGYLRFKFFDGKFSVEIGKKPNSTEIIDQNIAGRWKAIIYDQQYDEFKKKYRHNIDFDFNLTNSSDQLQIKGHLKTYDTTGVFIGEADIIGLGRMERSEYARITYSLKNKTVRGFGVIVLQIDPSGKHGSGFALYRRTNIKNGRFGLGKMELTRSDFE